MAARSGHRLSVAQPWAAASKAKPCTTPAPTPTPTDYALYAAGEHCLEAAAVAVQGPVDADSCWAACSAGGPTTPFYFSVIANTCHCSQTCTTVYDPNAVVRVGWGRDWVLR